MTASMRIFLSSTWQDFQPEREAVEKVLHRMRDTDVVGMEYFGSRPDTLRDASLNEVDHSEVYIGIFAHRYGSGITEAEYRLARAHNLPCLIYLKADDVSIASALIERDEEHITKLEALKQELMTHHIVSFFKSPDELAAHVVTDLHNLLQAGLIASVPATPKQHLTLQSGSDPLFDPVKVHRSLLDHFNREELRILCFQLGVDFDDLQGEGRSAKARELVRLMQRRNQLDRLQARIQQMLS